VSNPWPLEDWNRLAFIVGCAYLPLNLTWVAGPSLLAVGITLSTIAFFTGHWLAGRGKLDAAGIVLVVTGVLSLLLGAFFLLAFVGAAAIPAGMKISAAKLRS
jgi:hypothetical protein